MKTESEMQREERSGVAAAEVVLRVLAAFVGAEPLVMLKTLAERADMHPAKVHRYLVSLCRLGLVRQDETGLYQLADGALQLGLAAIESLDLATVAQPILGSLRRQTSLTSMLATWDVAGPVVAMRDLQPAPLMLSTRIGSTLPILGSATGMTFCAWLPRSSIERALARAGEMQRPAVNSGGRSASVSIADPASPRFESALQEVRRAGIAASSGQVNANLEGMSAPVFDGTGHIVAVLSVFGSAGQVNLEPDGPTATRLKAHATQLSEELGWSGSNPLSAAQ